MIDTMQHKRLEICYTEYSSLAELEPSDRELAEAAIDAMKGSYSPYSRFRVGAAVRLSGGGIVKGANQENSAFPSGLCAERTAMFAASYYGDEYGLAPSPATPCGACRQVMAQYQHRSGKPMKVLMVADGRIWSFEKVDDILPFIFDSI